MKHVLITGGSRGIGAAAVRAFAAEAAVKVDFPHVFHGYSSISFFAFESRGVEGGVGGVEEDTKRMETRAPSSSVISSMPKGEEKTVWAFISFP